MESIETRSSERRALRGKKRTCQEDECGERFYDLNKDPIACPVCAATFIPAPEVIASPKGYRGRPVYRLEKPEPKVEKIEPTDQNNAGTDVPNQTDEQVLDPADAAILLDNDDDDAVEKENFCKKDSISKDT